MRFILPPGPRTGIITNLAELRLYYFPEDGQQVMTFPIAIGRRGWRTPVGDTEIIGKKKNPTWTVPESIKEYALLKGKELPDKVFPGPDNPLDKFALRLGMRGYMIHGTNAPSSVGKLVSSGCMRIYPDDIEALFHNIDVGDSVRIVNQGYKYGWQGDELYLETHPPISGDVYEEQWDKQFLVDTLRREAKQRRVRIDWDLVNAVVDEKLGIPISIAKQTKSRRFYGQRFNN